MSKINLNLLNEIAKELSSRNLKVETEKLEIEKAENQADNSILEIVENINSLIEEHDNAQEEKPNSQTEDETTIDFGEEEPEEEEELKYFSPEEILSQLDEYIVGQDMAKQDIAIAVANHTKSRALDEDCGKSNIILIGETGTGKTEMMRALKIIVKKVGLSLAICDATKITDDGYLGLSANSVLTRLYDAASGNMAVAEWSIVFIDEFDKLLHDPMNTKGREGVFNSFLSIIEGGDIPTESSDGTSITINTEKTLFIIGGVFEDLEQGAKADKKSNIGFCRNISTNKKEGSNAKEVTPTDLADIGVPRELVGRFDVITRMDPMNKEMLREIFNRHVLPKYERRFKINGKTLKLAEYQIDEIIEEAIASKSGARGLGNKLADLLREEIFPRKIYKSRHKILH